MLLSDEHKSVVLNKISQLWKESRKCTVCGEEKWQLSGKIFSIPQFGPENQKAKQMYPVVILTCGHCGNSLMFNAMSLGFSFTSDGKEETQKPIN